MKSISIFILLLVALLFTKCGGKAYQPANIVLSENHMDFPETAQQNYKSITFEISPLFISNKHAKHVLKPYAFSKVIYELNLYLSVEVFSESEVKKIQEKFTESTNQLNAIHDYYISKREKSLYSPHHSIKKDLPKMKNKTGVIQVLQGATYSGSAVNSYFTSTLKIGNQFYVFQMIGKQDCMGYLYDDFQSILASVKKK